MPNHCDNRLTIEEGDKNAAHALIVNNSGEVDFNIAVPMPDDLKAPERTEAGSDIWPNPKGEKTDSCGVPLSIAEANTKKHGAANWYEWQCRMWGTKWNAYGQDEKLFEFSHEAPAGTGGYSFTTAWGPPTEWLLSLSRLLPEHVFRLAYDIELGNGRGWMEVKNGEITQDYSSDN